MSKFIIPLKKPVTGVFLNTSKKQEESPRTDSEGEFDIQSQLKQQYQKGFQDGVQSERQKQEQLKYELAEQFQQVIVSLIEQTREIQNKMATTVHKLSLQIARRLVGMELILNPEALEKIISDALKEAGDSREITVMLNPEDYQMLDSVASEIINDNTHRIRSTPNVERGGCIVETDTGIIDASLSTRIEEYLNYLKTRESE